MFRLFVIATVINTLLLSCSSTVAVSINTMSLKAMDFEVFGRVQGVFFRKILPWQSRSQPMWTNIVLMTWIVAVIIDKFTKGQADKLGIRGWCKNTDEGTVLGHMQGPIDKLESMMHWLKTEGSPSSKIEKAEFRNQKDITEYTFDTFNIIQ